MSRTAILSSFAVAAIAMTAGSAFGQAFVGNLAVSQIGRLSNGQAPTVALNNNGLTTSIRDYSASVSGATLNQTYYFNDGSTGTRLVSSGTATSSSYIRNSADNRYITIAGYDAALGTAGVTSSASSAINRTIGRLDVQTGAIEYTRLADPAYSGDNIRSVVSLDGSQYWIGGTATTAANAGVRYALHNTAVAQASTQLSTTATNVRNVDIVNGQLYVSSGSGAFRAPNVVGSGLPTTSGQTISTPAGFTDASASPFDYFFADANTLYVADDRTTVGGVGGLQKWVNNAGTWSRLWSLNLLNEDANASTTALTVGIRGLTGQVQADGSVSLFAITTNFNSTALGLAGVNSLVSFSDLITGTTLASGAQFNLLDTSAQNTTFRGVDIIPAPGTAALLALGGLVAGRRRRN
ncbi:MAG: hypothetical protein K2W85_10700 [Phycisphaerales bacterium]|nr:hypothetical protein [Phycisphaerales bacterium]